MVDAASSSFGAFQPVPRHCLEDACRDVCGMRTSSLFVYSISIWKSRRRCSHTLPPTRGWRRNWKRRRRGRKGKGWRWQHWSTDRRVASVYPSLQLPPASTKASGRHLQRPLLFPSHLLILPTFPFSHLHHLHHPFATTSIPLRSPRRPTTAIQSICAQSHLFRIRPRLTRLWPTTRSRRATKVCFPFQPSREQVRQLGERWRVNRRTSPSPVSSCITPALDSAAA